MGILKSVKVAVSKVVTNYKTVQSELKEASKKSGYTNEVVVKQVLPTAVKQAAAASGISAISTVPKVVSTVSAAAVTVAKSAGSSVKSTVSKNPISSAAAATFGTGLLIESKAPLKAAAKAPEAVFDAGTAVGKAIEGDTGALLDYAKEHPIATGAAAAGTAFLIGKSATGLLVTSKLLDTDNMQPVQSNIPTSNNTMPAIIPTTGTGTQVQPITPQTQVIGKSAGAKSVSRYRAKARKAPVQSMKINIINQSRIVQNRKFIY